MTLYESFLEALEKAIVENKNINHLADKSGVNYMTIKRWRTKDRVPNLDTLNEILPYLGGWPYNIAGESPDEALAAECQRLRAENVGLRKAVTDLQLAKARLEGQNDLLKEMLGEKKIETES